MARQLPVINAPIVQSTSEASASSVMERDSNGDVKAARPTATVALVSEGGLKLEYDAKTADYTATEAESLIACTAAALRTITLPAAASSAGQSLTIRKTDATAFPVLIDGNASETIDGETGIYLTLQYESVTVQCDATGWHIISRYLPQKSRALSATETPITCEASVLLCTAAADITLTLPAAAYWKGKTITVKKVDAGTGDVIIDANSTETIDGALTIPTGQIDERYETRVIYSDGTNWHVIQDYNPD
jgi:hypothetical protein